MLVCVFMCVCVCVCVCVCPLFKCVCGLVQHVKKAICNIISLMASFCLASFDLNHMIMNATCNEWILPYIYLIYISLSCVIYNIYLACIWNRSWSGKKLYGSILQCYCNFVCAVLQSAHAKKTSSRRAHICQLWLSLHNLDHFYSA